MISKLRQNWEITFGFLYAVLIMALGAYSNYVTTYDPNPTITPTLLEFSSYILLYLPLGFMVLIAKWSVAEFGFGINAKLGLATLLFIPICGRITGNIRIDWISATFESFARTGEEVFFRGFLFVLLLKIFAAKRKPWVWAASISALLFMLVHTQTFQPSFLDNYGTGSILYKVVERFLNIFFVGLFLALLRFWTDSILPGAIIHSVLAGGILTVPFCLTIYVVIVFIAYLRKESVLTSIQPKKL